MKLRLTMTTATAQLAKSCQAEKAALTDAIAATAREAAAKIKSLGDADISRAGNFGPRWRESLKVRSRRTPKGATITAKHTIPYADIFERGGVIHGRPLLWLPLPSAVVDRPRLYPGGLFSAKSTAGRPLLFSRVTKQPVFVGIPQVRIPKKFHLNQIIREVAATIPAIFRTQYRARRNGRY